jgi:hypothetical protein
MSSLNCCWACPSSRSSNETSGRAIRFNLFALRDKKDFRYFPSRMRQFNVDVTLVASLTEVNGGCLQNI